ncbi:peptide/nickel transport system permease protein [Malonomonas rubra DSM 5091]|uniref:Peptide/nickel transport system permease protein n=1 Tax=Malonomonas rubra DSM 5091 TaxID=1122189 RepID=A0A1M6FEW3_MALRU|nr:ABC transporter permease [Malonomonas rubra]SHI96215.1 peptide/nickel transport system permease protein [Malonomonas rubra DSM 5091]
MLRFVLIFNVVLLLWFVGEAKTNTDTIVSYGIFLLLTVLLGVMQLVMSRRRKQREDDIRTAWDLMWRKLRRNKSAMAGMWVVTALCYVAILAPFLVPVDPYNMDWGAMSLGPTAGHWLGTDEMGRDTLARTIYATRVAMGIGLLAVVLNSLLGTSLGLLAGYYGGKTDNIIMRLLEFWNSIPFILLAIALMAALGSGLFNLVLVVSLTGILEFARIIRGDSQLLKKADYVNAARVMGIPNRQILRRHILPNCLAPIIVMATLRIGETILTIAGLSFLGLGVQPPMPSLGSMLANGQQFLYENIYMSIVPGSVILLIVLAFNLFGDGLRDALDSRITQ